MSSDPLTILGSSLFLQILSHLPLESLQTCLTVSKSWTGLISSSTTTLYRPLAHQIGLEPPRLANLEETERNTAQSSTWLAPSDRGNSEEERPAGGVDWKDIIRRQVVLQQNWRKGRAKGKWICPGRNTVWRIKIDQEEETIITTSRIDGILVSDLKTSEPLFEYEEIGAYAHLEFVKGYAIFNSNDDRSFEVHITPSALSRLPPDRRRKLPPTTRSTTHGRGYSFTNEEHYEPLPSDSTEIPPRGHLTYYKTLTPRTDCFAFRARVDKQYTPEERLVFGTSSSEEAYIYDLQSESDEEMERFAYEPKDRGRPNYIEFDDDHLYICHQFSVNVYSRRTKRKLLTFPPLFTAPFDAASAIYTCYDTPKATTKIRPLVHDDVLVGELEVEGKWIDDPGFDGVMMASGQGRIAGREFSAIHYTSNDLFAITRSGTIYALRNYNEIFAIQDPDARDRAVNANSLAIVLRESLLQLSTYGEHVVVTSGTSVFLLHTESLPAPPFNRGISTAPRPTVQLTKLLNVHQKGMGQCSCLQMDLERIYAVYWALGDSEAGGTDDYEGNKVLPPQEAVGDFGLCVKVWDLSVEF
ncbi:uncharacterized protein I303_102974 [Kwoniella dejecticola CBS 10117]|uniref:F-box domain-containing protein n=1 Tax=Kwoniella dejecticola CBS 10117 TaxID=1296121 RepID=A0A1A6AA89_9TREE|nr:uncharacterized protein I303_02993 [Kwoniella dejecticola CBS 10117]OBR86971.1 hypothetical protein I303_02993 [Kwoniella dejecticola CBS 10117]